MRTTPKWAGKIFARPAVDRRDVVVGITASGRTPYVLGAVRYAAQVGAFTIGLCSNPDTAVSHLAALTIAPITGPEAIEGSTRMKSGTAQKMVLNMLSTGVMIRLGKVYGNRMVQMVASNEKLRLRAARMVSEVTGCPQETAAEQLAACPVRRQADHCRRFAGLRPGRSGRKAPGRR